MDEVGVGCQERGVAWEVEHSTRQQLLLFSGLLSPEPPRRRQVSAGSHPELEGGASTHTSSSIRAQTQIPNPAEEKVEETLELAANPGAASSPVSHQSCLAHSARDGLR
ncbi:hypothetical protein GN956_G25570 [Arapaima gigas]